MLVQQVLGHGHATMTMVVFVYTFVRSRLVSDTMSRGGRVAYDTMHDLGFMHIHRHRRIVQVKKPAQSYFYGKASDTSDFQSMQQGTPSKEHVP